MSHQTDLISTDIEAYLRQHEHKDMLRFITCGSVDDGKSTLIGRLLYDSKMIFDDQLSALENDSRKVGTQGGDLDFALLVDGLAAEREQGITIDVAYRFFTTDRRKFIVADTPGHEQYTRNMATGASTADLAVVLIDARKGILTQTRRHSYIISLLGIRDVVLAVNKMDLMGYDQAVFDSIVSDYKAFADSLGISRVTAIPMSALKGDNILTASQATPWYHGPALLPFLETVQISHEHPQQAFRLPVQWVNRPNLDFRGYCGTVTGGSVRPGEEIVVTPGGRRSRIARIVTHDGDRAEVFPGEAVTLTLEDEIDISRGDIISTVRDPAPQSSSFSVHLLWMSEQPMLPGRSYLFRTATATVPGQVTDLRHKINVNTLEHLAAKKLELNEVASCEISLDREIAFDSYQDNRDTGSFIVIDRLTNLTVAAGMIRHSLRRATNVHWQHLDVDKEARAGIKGQRPAILWFTGLSGAGKSTIANMVEKNLHANGRHTFVLDGDNVRHGLNRDLGFTAEDRVENIRRVGEVARLMSEAGLLTLVSFISPFRSERQMVREMVPAGEFIEIHISTPLEVCEQRDVKGLYHKARTGALKNFTGIDSPYEVPENPELTLDASTATPEELALQVVDYLGRQGFLPGETDYSI